MKFENSKFYTELKPFKLALPFGNCYFFDNFLISEIAEGVHFDWKKAEMLIAEIFKFYGKNTQVGFISNRMNHYSIDPQNWVKLEKKYSLIVASAIVIYNNSNFMNASIEKQFASKSIKRCRSLAEAIDWMISLKELN